MTVNIFDKILQIAHDNFHLPNSRHRHFSFIVLRNKVISWGYNDGWTTHPLSVSYNYRFDAKHSELSAIINFPYRPSKLKNYTLINLRLLADRSVGLSKPCKLCSKLLSDFGVYDVYYSTSGGSFERL